jgi:hypothetical protein
VNEVYEDAVDDGSSKGGFVIVFRPAAVLRHVLALGQNRENRPSVTIKVRAAIHLFDFLDTRDEDILARLESACSEGIVNLQTVQLWTAKFRNGRTEHDDEPRPERLRQNRKLPIRRGMTEENRYLSQKKTARTLSFHRDIVKRLIIEPLNLRRVIFKWFFYIITASQNEKGSRFRGNFSDNSTNYKLTISLMSSRGMKLGSALKIRGP